MTPPISGGKEVRVLCEGAVGIQNSQHKSPKAEGVSELQQQARGSCG